MDVCMYVCEDEWLVKELRIPTFRKGLTQDGYFYFACFVSALQHRIHYSISCVVCTST